MSRRTTVRQRVLMASLAASTWLLVACCVTDATIADRSATRQAIERAVPLLQHSMNEWFESRSCTSCHHHSLGTMALAFLDERGVAIDQQHLRNHAHRLATTCSGGMPAAIENRAGINAAFGRGYQLVAAAAAGAEPNEMTAALACLLLAHVGPDGSWRSESYRPPHESSDVTMTALAVRALQAYTPAGRAAEVETVVSRAGAWLATTPMRTTEDHTFRLLGLMWAGAPTAHREHAAALLLAAQRSDGGWNQSGDEASDTYSTAEAMLALVQTGSIDVDGAAMVRARNLLLRTQLPDGSWHVRTRRIDEGLEQFDSGFPHGEDQFVSFAATAFAVMALGCAIDARPSQALGLAEAPPRPARPQSTVADPVQLMLTSDRATACSLSSAQISMVGPGGVTPLHAAVHDAQRVAWLLANGAAPDPVSASGTTPLMLAAARCDGAQTVRLLLDAGANVNAANREGLTPWLMAARSGSTATLELLRERGAERRVAAVDGATDLHIAASVVDETVVRWLLADGATTERRAADGSTPFDWLSDRNARIATLLATTER